MPEAKQALCRCVVDMLQTAVTHRRTSTKDLVGLTGLSPHTVDNYFRTAGQVYGVSTRAEVLITALSLGHVRLQPEQDDDAAAPPSP